MHIVWFSWKDRGHPLAGGAEAVSGSIMDRLVRDGHSVTLITAQYPGSRTTEVSNSGIHILRGGNRYSVYWRAKKLYKTHVANLQKPDLVIDEMNTIPFFAATYVDADRCLLLTYQLAREVWFYQMAFPFSCIGFALEPLMLHVLSRFYQHTLTESRSSRDDLHRYGFKNVRIFTAGIDIQPLPKLPKKRDRSLVLSLGAIRPMKRTLHAVKAFEYARDLDVNLHMVIAGDKSSRYAAKVLAYIAKSRHSDAIDLCGSVSHDRKISLMQQAGVIVVTSIKEGWGLIVTEANSQGTPAIVYDVDGLRDSTQHDKTGFVTPNGNSRLLGQSIVRLVQSGRYESLRKKGWAISKAMSLEHSYTSFCKEAGITPGLTLPPAAASTPPPPARHGPAA